MVERRRRRALLPFSARTGMWGGLGVGPPRGEPVHHPRSSVEREYKWLVSRLGDQGIDSRIRDPADARCRLQLHQVHDVDTAHSQPPEVRAHQFSTAARRRPVCVAARRRRQPHTIVRLAALVLLPTPRSAVPSWVCLTAWSMVRHFSVGVLLPCDDQLTSWAAAQAMIGNAQERCWAAGAGKCGSTPAFLLQRGRESAGGYLDNDMKHTLMGV